MEYIANPVTVTAFKIEKIIDCDDKGNLELLLEDGREVVATREMMARLIPSVGDYWVRQQDGYVYLNPKEVFERKYSKNVIK